jgi:hypothetical protein
MKALLFTLIRAFEFELAVPAEDIHTKQSIVQRPVVASEIELGSQMPLLIRPYCTWYAEHIFEHDVSVSHLQLSGIIYVNTDYALVIFFIIHLIIVMSRRILFCLETIARGDVGIY